MLLTEISMQIISMLFVLIIGLYLLMFAFTFYRKEKKRTREQEVRRYTFECCTKEMQKLYKYTYNDEFSNKEDASFAILNIFDRLAVGVYTEVLAEEVVIMYFGSYMRRFYKDNRLNLFEIRKVKNDSGLYANYERFMEEWDFRKESKISLDSRRMK